MILLLASYFCAAVFSPLKISRSGLVEVVAGRGLIYGQKERKLDNVEQRDPAEHYMLVDRKIADPDRGGTWAINDVASSALPMCNKNTMVLGLAFRAGMQRFG